MNQSRVVQRIALIVLLMLGSCGNIDVLVSEIGVDPVSYEETIHINNCGGKASSEQTVSRSFDINIEGVAEFDAGYKVVEGSVTAKYGQYRNVTKSQKLAAPPGTNMEFVLKWSEHIYAGNVMVNGTEGYYKVRVPIAVEQVSSQDLGCPSQPGDGEVSPPLVTQQNTVSDAARKCQEFQGTPIARDSITSEQVSIWRGIGRTDRAGTARVIYCEIHQVPGQVNFVEGDTIPADVIITADLGFNWASTYPGALERLVHNGGGWGVFLSLNPFVVQHASDVPNDVGGQYWPVK